MEKALSNITVLDLTRVLAGPYCTMMLADYGANVIKIEVPGRGDDTRGMGPKKNDYSMYYAYVNRGKKGVTLNLKSEEGKKLFVHHIKDVEAGQTVEFDKVLLVDKDGSITVGAPAVEGAKVVVEVVNPLVKGDKVIVFKMKRRKDYRKKNGHRTQFTEVSIKSVIA